MNKIIKVIIIITLFAIISGVVKAETCDLEAVAPNYNFTIVLHYNSSVYPDKEETMFKPDYYETLTQVGAASSTQLEKISFVHSLDQAKDLTEDSRVFLGWYYDKNFKGKLEDKYYRTSGVIINTEMIIIAKYHLNSSLCNTSL